MKNNKLKIRKNNVAQAIIHCNSCRGIVIKDIEASGLEGEISFLVRCPHCFKDCKININAYKEVKISLE